MRVLKELEKRLFKREENGNLRCLRTVRGLIDFASNDYLGLSKSEVLKQLVLKEWKELESFCLGSSGSRLLTGNSSYAEAVEQQIAQYHGFEAGLLFSCGYMANVGLFSSLAQADDQIFYDTHVHASAHDGIRLSRAQGLPFRHNDVSHLESRLQRASRKGRRFVCVDSVYSTDGSLAPLEEIWSVCSQYGAELIVDEAHAVGVLGPKGKGRVAEKNLDKKVLAQLCTFGKALGSYGAIVLGSSLLKEYLLNFARSCIYTTAVPSYILAPIKCAYDYFPSMEKERAHLQVLRNVLQQDRKSVATAPIQSFKVRGNIAVRHLSKQLAHGGFDVRPLMSPTVPRGEECLRICLHAFNTKEEVEALRNCLEFYGESEA